MTKCSLPSTHLSAFVSLLHHECFPLNIKTEMNMLNSFFFFGKTCQVVGDAEMAHSMTRMTVLSQILETDLKNRRETLNVFLGEIGFAMTMVSTFENLS